MMLTIGLVVMVIFLFLRNLSATVIPSVAVPLSLVGTFGVMYLLGYSLNNLTLMALTISTGFVVDDAIVMIENIDRYLEEGETPLERRAQRRRPDRFHDRFSDRLADRRADSAAIHGRHRRPPVPRIRRHAGRHDPRLRGRLADAHADDVRETPEDERIVEARPLLRSLRASLRARDRRATGGPCSGSCKHQTATLIVTVGTLVFTIFLFIIVPKGFFPVQDTGVILGISEAPQTVSFNAMAQRQQALAQVILKDPAVDSLSSFIGIDGINTTPNSGRIQINLKPQKPAQRFGFRDHSPAAAGAGEGGRHHPLHAAGAGPDGRRSRQPHAISVFAGDRRCATI